MIVSCFCCAGHEDEVASVGSSLAGYFGVFHRLMASRLKEVPMAGAARLAAIAEELADSCGGAEHSFTHAVQLLTHLGAHKHGASDCTALFQLFWNMIRAAVYDMTPSLSGMNLLQPMTSSECVLSPTGANFRRLAQELESHASAARLAGPDLWRMQPWLARPGSSPEDAEARCQLHPPSKLKQADARHASGMYQQVCHAALLHLPQHHACICVQYRLQVAALLVDLLTGASGEAQRVSRLRQLYAVQHPPSVELLQQPQVLAKLVHSIFGAKPPPADALEATAAVAALAAAAIDERCG